MVPKRKDYGSDLFFSDLCVSAFSARYFFKGPRTNHRVKQGPDLRLISQRRGGAVVKNEIKSRSLAAHFDSLALAHARFYLDSSKTLAKAQSRKEEEISSQRRGEKIQGVSFILNRRAAA
jgi:hypothetical protein